MGTDHKSNNAPAYCESDTQDFFIEREVKNTCITLTYKLVRHSRIKRRYE